MGRLREADNPVQIIFCASNDITPETIAASRSIAFFYVRREVNVRREARWRSFSKYIDLKKIPDTRPGIFQMMNAFKSVGIAKMVEAINAPIGAGTRIE